MSISILLAVAAPCLFLWPALLQVQAAEPIADIGQYTTVYSSPDSRYEFTLLAIANLSNVTIDGYKIHELSGLAWDEDEGLLYALSDNGYVLHLLPVFDNGLLVDVLFVNGYSLQDKNKRPLRYKESDSEGISVKNSNNSNPGDSRLIVSFERIPRLVEYNTDGTLIAEIGLPAELADINNYRGENKSLEAVTVHDRFGILTGPEHPLTTKSSTNALDIYSLNGDYWSFPVHNQHYGALVGMTGMKDGSILALERSYGGLFPATETSLHRILLEQDKSSPERIVTFGPENGLLNDNFEGITYFRDDHYFMISDENNHPFKRTRLVYFSVTLKKEQ